MVHAVNFDTLAYANRLKQAEAQPEAPAGIFDYQAATKKDLQDMAAKLEIKILEVKSETKKDLQDTAARLEIKILEIKSDIIKWVIGLLFAQSALLISFLKIFH